MLIPDDARAAGSPPSPTNSTRPGHVQQHRLRRRDAGIQVGATGGEDAGGDDGVGGDAGGNTGRSDDGALTEVRRGE